MFKDEDYLKVIVWLLSSCIGLIIFIVGLVGYIFKEHIKDNHVCFAKNDHEHERIFDKIDCKEDKI